MRLSNYVRNGTIYFHEKIQIHTFELQKLFYVTLLVHHANRHLAPKDLPLFMAHFARHFGHKALGLRNQFDIIVLVQDDENAPTMDCVMVGLHRLDILERFQNFRHFGQGHLDASALGIALELAFQGLAINVQGPQKTNLAMDSLGLGVFHPGRHVEKPLLLSRSKCIASKLFSIDGNLVSNGRANLLGSDLLVTRRTMRLAAGSRVTLGIAAPTFDAHHQMQVLGNRDEVVPIKRLEQIDLGRSGLHPNRILGLARHVIIESLFVRRRNTTLRHGNVAKLDARHLEREP